MFMKQTNSINSTLKIIQLYGTMQQDQQVLVDQQLLFQITVQQLKTIVLRDKHLSTLGRDQL